MIADYHIKTFGVSLKRGQRGLTVVGHMDIVTPGSQKPFEEGGYMNVIVGTKNTCSTRWHSGNFCRVHGSLI